MMWNSERNSCIIFFRSFLYYLKILFQTFFYFLNPHLLFFNILLTYFMHHKFCVQFLSTLAVSLTMQRAKKIDSCFLLYILRYMADTQI